MASEVITIDRWASDLQRTMLPEVQTAAANFALEALADTQVINRSALGYLPAVVTRVDGRVATATLAALAAVKIAQGVIDFVFEVENLDDVLLYIAAELPRRSPRVSGDYISGHILLADGVEVPMRAPFPSAREFVFINAVPYARKIEIGTTKGGRPFVVQVQPYIYESTAQAAQQLFPNVRIRSEFMALNAGSVREWARSTAGMRHASRTRRGSFRQHHAWLTRQPAIIVEGRPA